MEDSRNIIKAIDALTLKAGGEVVDSKNITEAIDNLKEVYSQEAIGIDDTLTQEGLAADAKAVGDLFSNTSAAQVQIGGTYQIPTYVFERMFVIIFIGRYAWGDCLIFPTVIIKEGAISNGGTKTSIGSSGQLDKYYVISISPTGLLKIKTESTALDAANIRCYGFGPIINEH